MREALLSDQFLTLGGLALMSLAHIWGYRISQLDTIKTRGWISFSAGASVAYVFVHVFPETGIFQQQMFGHGDTVSFVKEQLYLAALGGLCFLFLLDSIEQRFIDEKTHPSQPYRHFLKLFWLRAILYGLYNVMVAYMVTEKPASDLVNILLIAVAFMLHFIVLNTGFIEDYGIYYQKHVRWLVVAGLFLGWLLGIFTGLADEIVATCFAFIGGMITYVALKSELTETKNQAPLHFLAGAAVYSLIILTILFFDH